MLFPLVFLETWMNDEYKKDSDLQVWERPEAWLYRNLWKNNYRTHFFVNRNLFREFSVIFTKCNLMFALLVKFKIK